MFDFKTAAMAATGRLSSIVTSVMARRVVLPLLYADDRMLRDIGLSRTDIVDCLSGPLCADPTALLIARREQRRKTKGGSAANNVVKQRSLAA